MAREQKPPARYDFTHCLSLPQECYKQFPDCPAVYLVYAEPDILLYVGKTVSLLKRWPNDHRRVFKKAPSIRVAWFPLPAKILHKVETQLIRKYGPAMNSHYHDTRQTAYVYRHDTHLRKYLKQIARSEGDGK